MMKLTLGFSPCPNDTFIFDAMVNGKIDTMGLEFDYVMEDVETLNQRAEKGQLDITKLSFSAFLQTIDKYILLNSGSALGKGVGPLLVAKKAIGLENIHGYKIAIPGIGTTANLLLSLAYPEVKNKTELLFSKIEQAVLDEEYDAGLIIHESRFTYEQKGLVKLLDLGDWWEQNAKAAIPLGGIVAKRTLEDGVCRQVDEIIKASIQYSWDHYPKLSPFVTNHAQEMSEDVMRQHIELYVNEYTVDLGAVGRNAVHVLFEKAFWAGIVDDQKKAYQIFC